MDRSVKTCVRPDGGFLVGLHKPHYRVVNKRLTESIQALGATTDGEIVENHLNFPKGDMEITKAQPVYEIPNAFPFWGTTYILGDVAKRLAKESCPVSFSPKGKTSFSIWDDFHDLSLKDVPRPIVIAIAQTCTNPELLVRLLPLAAQFVKDENGMIAGLCYEKDDKGFFRPKILDHDLYETLGNNPALPDFLKQVMLLRPGVQGTSPIVGEYIDKDRCHIWEYLRANSYIPWGHYAANMAEDSIRYSVRQLDLDDMMGLRHLYYQRVYVSLAAELGLKIQNQGLLTESQLEDLRVDLHHEFIKRRYGGTRFSATLWGWNYGYDFSPSGFRLHASHQQIHQQFALIPEYVESIDAEPERLPAYAVGDMVGSFIQQYQQIHGTVFFEAYVKAILSNERMDGKKDLDKNLIVFKDDNVLLFVPKAQRFHGELHLLCLKKVGNILEADSDTRFSINKGIFIAVRVLERLGARMITSFELSKRFGLSTDQRLMYCFIPKHPQSPGAFSEQQARWITGHFPEDFARSCRRQLEALPHLKS